MSSQIETARGLAFATSVFAISQQKTARLRGTARTEMVSGAKAKFFDRIGLAEFSEVSSRHADTTYTDTPHTRRMVVGKVYRNADLIDEPDRMRMVWDPAGPYQQAFAKGFGRKMDDICIDALSAAAATGEDGSGSASLGNGQKIASVASTAGAKLNVQALRRAVKILNENEVDDEDRFCILNANQLENMLTQTEITSADYNTVRALVRGEIDTFLGLKFIRSERIDSQGSALSFDTTTGAVGSGGGDANGYDKVLVYQKNALLLAIWEDYKGRVSEMPNKNYSTQIWAEFYAGAVRMEEEAVVEVLCKTT